MEHRGSHYSGGVSPSAAAIDRINARFGEFTVAPAELLARSSMPNVIAPAWRSDGMRQHIPD